MARTVTPPADARVAPVLAVAHPLTLWQEICPKMLLRKVILCSLLVMLACPGFADSPSDNDKMEPRISVITLGVTDVRKSFVFYKDGLGFPTKMNPDAGIVLFATSGTRLFLYSYSALAYDAGIEASKDAGSTPKFHGFTFGHCVRKKEEVDAILSLAANAGGRIVKSAKLTSWGGYSGYFADPDGYLWEVAYAEQWKFNADGTVVVE